jgi:hypothetical protein
MKDGAIKKKNNVKMSHGKQFLRSAGDFNYFGIRPKDCRCCGILNQTKLKAKSKSIDHSTKLVYFLRYLLIKKQLWI